MELPNIAAYAYQDVHVWSALLTCLRPRILFECLFFFVSIFFRCLSLPCLPSPLGYEHV